jgi:hypothetical protein
MFNHGQGRRTVVGTYPNGATVRVRRAEEHDAQALNLAYAVTIEAPFATAESKIVDGMDAIKMHLKVRHLPVTAAEWSIDE